MEQQELTKKFYRIADVSELTGVPQSALRFWEREFSELRPRRNAGGQRMYTPRDVELIQLIAFLLKQRGLKIDAARNYIRHNRADLDRRHRIIERLRSVRNRITDILDAMETRH